MAVGEGAVPLRAVAAGALEASGRMKYRPGTPVALTLAMIVATSAAPAMAADLAESAEPEIPTFVDETLRSGLDHVSTYEATPQSPDGGWEYIVGGGLAVLDCDDDELPDLYLAGGSSPASLYRNTSTLGGPLAFEPLESPVTDLAHVTGAYPIDVDSDGVTDLAVLRRGENALLRGLGDCRFEGAAAELGVPGGSDWTTAFSATWEPGAAIPTMVFGNYQALDEDGELVPGRCAEHRLLRPTADGRGYGPVEDLGPGHCTLSMLFSDWDRSGRRDLRASNDRQYYVTAGEEQLWRMEPGVPPHAYGPDDGWGRVMLFGMGIASQDISGDGRPEVYLTSIGHNRLQALVDGADGPEYRDIARDVGASNGRAVAGSDTRPSTSWHPEWDDVNNDGLVDLYVSKGNLDASPDNAIIDPSSLLLGSADGTFVERAAESGLANEARARGAALVDLNLDGLLDVVEVNLGDTAEVWRNAGAGTATEPAPMGHWLALEPAQDGPNRDA
ncbi:MAG: VCBS repeat-containing protein, partial [Candidatus Limnocylindrales bacterium]